MAHPAIWALNCAINLITSVSEEHTAIFQVILPLNELTFSAVDVDVSAKGGTSSVLVSYPDAIRLYVDASCVVKVVLLEFKERLSQTIITTEPESCWLKRPLIL